MPFREKTAWIAVVSMTVIYAYYFWSVIQHRPETRFPYVGLLATVVALIVVQVVLTIGAAIFSPSDAKAPRDEREKLIELRATRVAYSGLATGVACACLFGAFNPPIVFNVNALLFILVTTEIMRCSCLIIQYRRSA
jgi:hypothetical protein